MEAGAELVIAHHPLIYHPLRRLDIALDPIARAVATLVKADIALYAMHTNWDRAEGGINDTLAELLGLQNVRQLGGHGEQGIGASGRFTRAHDACTAAENGGISAVMYRHKRTARQRDRGVASDFMRRGLRRGGGVNGWSSAGGGRRRLCHERCAASRIS